MILYLSNCYGEDDFPILLKYDNHLTSFVKLNIIASVYINIYYSYIVRHYIPITIDDCNQTYSTCNVINRTLNLQSQCHALAPISLTIISFNVSCTAIASINRRWKHELKRMAIILSTHNQRLCHIQTNQNFSEDRFFKDCIAVLQQHLDH